jgi:cobalamin-dependent methionine synthase I
MQVGYPEDMAVISLRVEDMEEIPEYNQDEQEDQEEEQEQQREEQQQEEQEEQEDHQHHQPQEDAEEFQRQVPHFTGLGNLRNPYNGCYAAVVLQFLVASEIDLNLDEGIVMCSMYFIHNYLFSCGVIQC